MKRSTNGKKTSRGHLKRFADNLRDPLRMRVAVALVMIAVMFFAVSDPLHGRTRKGQQDLHRLIETVKAAEEVELLKLSLEGLQSRVFQEQGNHEITAYFIEMCRELPIELIQINTETPKRLGSIYRARVTLDCAGEFADLSTALHRLESQPKLIRIETIEMDSPGQNSTLPRMRLSLQVLKEKR